MAKKENLIHIRLDYNESISAKKDILSSQIGLLKIAKITKEYRLYRNEEIELKELLHKKIDELESFFDQLQKIMPKAKLPKILRKEGHEDTGKIHHKKKKSHEQNIEEQLQEIQNRLSRLQENNV